MEGRSLPRSYPSQVRHQRSISHSGTSGPQFIMPLAPNIALPFILLTEAELRRNVAITDPHHGQVSELNSHTRSVGISPPQRQGIPIVRIPTATVQPKLKGTEKLLGTSLPKSERTSVSARFIAKNLEKLNQTNQQRVRRVSFAAGDKPIQTHVRRMSFAAGDQYNPSMTLSAANFDIGQNLPSGSLNQNLEQFRYRRRSSPASKYVVTGSLNRDSLSTKPGDGIYPGANSPIEGIDSLVESPPSISLPKCENPFFPGTNTPCSPSLKAMVACDQHSSGDASSEDNNVPEMRVGKNRARRPSWASTVSAISPFNGPPKGRVSSVMRRVRSTSLSSVISSSQEDAGSPLHRTPRPRAAHVSYTPLTPIPDIVERTREEYFHAQGEDQHFEVFQIQDLEPRDLHSENWWVTAPHTTTPAPQPSVAIAPVAATQSTIRIVSSGSFKAPIPSVFQLRTFSTGHFPENIDGLTNIDSKASSPAQTIVRRNSWVSDFQAEGDVDRSQDTLHPEEQSTRQTGINDVDAATDTVGTRQQRKEDNDSDDSIKTEKAKVDKGKGRATDDPESEDHNAQVGCLADSTEVARSRAARAKAERLVSASSTDTVIHIGTSNNDNTGLTELPTNVQPKSSKESSKPLTGRQKAEIWVRYQQDQGMSTAGVIAGIRPENTTFTFESSDNNIAYDHPHTSFTSRPLAPLPPRHNVKSRASLEPVATENTRLRRHNEQQWPTLDSFFGYETFSEIAAEAARQSEGNGEKGFLRRLMEFLLCGCCTSRKKNKKPANGSGENNDSHDSHDHDNGSDGHHHEPGDGCCDQDYSSSSGECDGVSGSKTRMQNYGSMVAKDFSAPKIDYLRSFLPGGSRATERNLQDAAGGTITTGSGGQVTGGQCGETAQDQNDAASTRWLFHPAYELDSENASEYAYVSEGSDPEATAIWRGAVRHRHLQAAQARQREDARKARDEFREKTRACTNKAGRKRRTFSEDTVSGSIFSEFASTTRLTGDANANGEAGGDGEEGESAYHADGDSVVSYTGACDTHSEDWETQSLRSAWSFPNSQQRLVPATPLARPRANSQSSITSIGSFRTNHFTGPSSRPPSISKNTLSKPAYPDSNTLSHNGATQFPAGKDNQAHGYFVQKLRSHTSGTFNGSDQSINSKSVYPTGLPEGGMSSRNTSYGSYLASTSGGARGCFETNIKNFGVTSMASPLLTQAQGQRRKGSGERAPLEVIEADTTVETYMHRRAPAAHRGKESGEERGKIKKECKAGREKLGGFYAEVVEGRMKAKVKDFDGEEDSDGEEAGMERSVQV